MLPPIQSQDLVQRSDTLSELRSHEQGKAFGDIIKSTTEMHRLEELKNNTVQKDDDSEGVNPDGGGSKQEQQKKKQKEESQPETNTPAGHPLRLDGGDVIDLMA
jgi:hypothetical protein